MIFPFFFLKYCRKLHFTTLSGHDSVSERPVSGAYRLPRKPIIPRYSWHEPPSHMMVWQSGNQRRKRFARDRSLSCATHVKSLSRHKWFADCCRPLENRIWPFGRVKPAVWGRNMQETTWFHCTCFFDSQGKALIASNTYTYQICNFQGSLGFLLISKDIPEQSFHFDCSRV